MKLIIQSSLRLLDALEDDAAIDRALEADAAPRLASQVVEVLATKVNAN